MKTKDHIKSEIVAQLHQQSLGMLIDALAEAQAKIGELEQKLNEAQKPVG